MDQKVKLRKKLRALTIILIVVIIPGIVRIINNNAFGSIRAVDIAILFVSGMITGGLLITLKEYLSFKND